MKTYLKMVMALMAVIIVLGCTPVADNTVTSSDTSYVESLIKSSGQNTIQLDLSDARQYDYVKAAYLAAGQTPANSSELYADLEKARAAGAQVAKSVSRDVVVTEADYIEERAFMVSTVYTVDDRFYTSLTSTVKDGTVRTTIRLRITDTKTGKILTSGPSGWIIKNEYAGGKCVVITVDLPLPVANGWTVVKVEGMEQININGVVKTSTTIVKALVGPFSDATMEKIHILQPQDFNKDGKITLGVGRPVYTPAECTVSTIDYPFIANDGYRIRVPWQGYFQFPFPLTLDQINKKGTYIKLSGPTYGGTTEMMYQGVLGQTFKDALTLSLGPNNSKLIQWNIPRANGTFNNPALYCPLAKVNWYINFTFNNVVLDPSLPPETLVYCASSDINAANLLSDEYPPYLAFCWSCVAEGSVITMADGSFLPIEKIKAGDMVRGKKMDLTVISTASGREVKPVLRIVDESAHNLLVSETHPIVTRNRGMIAAKLLKVGDMIITERGVQKVVYIGKEKYEGLVYNLELGNAAEKAKMDKVAGNMYYANGILVGDLAMQMTAEADMQR